MVFAVSRRYGNLYRDYGDYREIRGRYERRFYAIASPYTGKRTYKRARLRRAERVRRAREKTQ